MNDQEAFELTSVVHQSCRFLLIGQTVLIRMMVKSSVKT